MCERASVNYIYFVREVILRTMKFFLEKWANRASLVRRTNFTAKQHHFHVKSMKKGGESNAKMHLVLTPDVFALRLNTAIFDCFAVENRKFRATKKPTVGFFEQRLRQ